jgi:hypothetical protein
MDVTGSSIVGGLLVTLVLVVSVVGRRHGWFRRHRVRAGRTVSPRTKVILLAFTVVLVEATTWAIEPHLPRDLPFVETGRPRD